MVLGVCFFLTGCYLRSDLVDDSVSALQADELIAGYDILHTLIGSNFPKH